MVGLQIEDGDAVINKKVPLVTQGQVDDIHEPPTLEAWLDCAPCAIGCYMQSENPNGPMRRVRTNDSTAPVYENECVRARVWCAGRAA